MCREGSGKPTFKKPKYVTPEPIASEDQASAGPSSKRQRTEEPEETGVVFNPSLSAHKYSLEASASFSRIFGNSVSSENQSLLSAAFSSGTWKSYKSSWNNMSAFCKCKNKNLSFPLSQEFINSYINWLVLEKNLKYTTVSSYLSSLNSVLKLKGLDSPNLDSFMTKTLLRGGKTVTILNQNPRPTRKVMTLDLLKILGHEIANSDWAKDSKRVFWSASCVLFFGSFRIGEILSDKESSFDPTSCLLWKDILFRQDSILIHVKLPKNRTEEGDYVDIFRFPEESCCPVRALLGLKNTKNMSKVSDKPVFAFENGKLLSANNFNLSIRNLLKKHLGAKSMELSSHSFRAAIPSALAKFPDKGVKENIKDWGRWDSPCYLRYTRLKMNQRKEIFSSVCKVLLHRSA